MSVQNIIDHTYCDLIAQVRNRGHRLFTRNAYRTRLIAQTVHLDRTPLVSARKTAWRNALREWEWFMSGSNNVNALHESVRHWWKPWANAYGEVKYNYSKQFRCFDGGWGRKGFDQLTHWLDGVRDHPNSTRNVMTTWHSEEMAAKDCPITNCHGTVIQAFVTDGVLDIFTYQRSCDLVCGVPHNWIQYWAFLLWAAHRTGHRPGAVTWTGGDVHLYEEHLPMADRLIALTLQELLTDGTPELVYTPTSDEFIADDFQLNGPYQPVITDSVKMIV